MRENNEPETISRIAKKEDNFPLPGWLVALICLFGAAIGTYLGQKTSPINSTREAPPITRTAP